MLEFQTLLRRFCEILRGASEASEVGKGRVKRCAERHSEEAAGQLRQWVDVMDLIYGLAGILYIYSSIPRFRNER